jgi:hypothetical protein
MNHQIWRLVLIERPKMNFAAVLAGLLRPRVKRHVAATIDLVWSARSLPVWLAGPVQIQPRAPFRFLFLGDKVQSFGLPSDRLIKGAGFGKRGR